MIIHFSIVLPLQNSPVHRPPPLTATSTPIVTAIQNIPSGQQAARHRAKASGTNVLSCDILTLNNYSRPLSSHRYSRVLFVRCYVLRRSQSPVIISCAFLHPQNKKHFAHKLRFLAHSQHFGQVCLLKQLQRPHMPFANYRTCVTNKRVQKQ